MAKNKSKSKGGKPGKKLCPADIGLPPTATLLSPGCPSPDESYVPEAPAATAAGEAWLGAQMVEVSKLQPFDWNPNEMTPQEFNNLVEQIQREGFDEPLQIVKKEDGTLWILGGEHRYRACKVLGLEKVPAVLKDIPESEWKTYVVRRNIVRGDLNKDKFTRIVKDVVVGDDFGAVSAQMGFDNVKEMMRHYNSEAAAGRAADSVLKQAETELDAVHNMSHILNSVFAQYGDTLPAGFVFFCYGKRMHLMVQGDDRMGKAVEALVAKLKDSGANANEVLAPVLESIEIKVEAPAQ